MLDWDSDVGIVWQTDIEWNSFSFNDLGEEHIDYLCRRYYGDKRTATAILSSDMLLKPCEWKCDDGPTNSLESL
jgi:hypothetical protein